MSNKRTSQMTPEDDPSLSLLVAELSAIHATPLPAPLRVSIRQRALQHARLPLQMREDAAGGEQAANGPLQPIRITIGRRARRRSTRAWLALLATALVVICLAVLATLASQVGGLLPSHAPTATPAISATTSGFVFRI